MNCPVLTWFQPVYYRHAGKPETNLSGHFQNSVAAEVTRLKLEKWKSQSLLTSAATVPNWHRLFRFFHHEHFDGHIGGHKFKAKLVEHHSFGGILHRFP